MGSDYKVLYVSGTSALPQYMYLYIQHAFFVYHLRYIVDKHKEKGSVCLHKEWANFPEPFAYQTTVRDITAFAPEFREKVTTLSELFLPKTYCFVLSNPHYGSLAEV